MSEKSDAIKSIWTRMSKGIVLYERHGEISGERCRNIKCAHNRDCAGCNLVHMTKYCRIWKLYKKLYYESEDLWATMTDEEKEEANTWTLD